MQRRIQLLHETEQLRVQAHSRKWSKIPSTWSRRSSPEFICIFFFLNAIYNDHNKEKASDKNLKSRSLRWSMDSKKYIFITLRDVSSKENILYVRIVCFFANEYFILTPQIFCVLRTWNGKKTQQFLHRGSGNVNALFCLKLVPNSFASRNLTNTNHLMQ